MVIRKTRALLAEFGFAGAMIHLLRRAGSEIQVYSPSRIRERRERGAKEALFDRAHGVNTGGDARLSALDIRSENRRFGVNYRGIDPDEFHRGFSRLSIHHPDFTFVDFGSGKGRAVLMASEFPFRRIVGVEFAAELHRIAEVNVARYSSPTRRCHSIDLQCMDVADYELTDEPLVLFLYNPFGKEVIEKIAKRIQASYQSNPREIFILYANPFQVNAWANSGFTVVDSGDLFAILKPTS